MTKIIPSSPSGKDPGGVFANRRRLVGQKRSKTHTKPSKGRKHGKKPGRR